MSQARFSISDAERELAAGYVLGDLDATELAQFEALLQQNPALEAEVQSLQSSLHLLPHGLEVQTPPPQLGDRILAAYTLSAVPSRRSIPLAAWLAAISLLSALLLGMDNWQLRRQLEFAQRTTPDRVATILQRPNSRLIALRSQGAEKAAGTVLFTPGQWQEVVVSLGDLPPLPPEQIYRMWLTLANGDTLPCGEFNPDPSGAVFIKINPPKTPPKGIKATGVFVTIDTQSAPLRPIGTPILSGEI
jgi:hypothetical protein